MHTTLQRQLTKLRLDRHNTPDSANWIKLLETIENSYGDFDEQRYLLERSLKISSGEMRALNRELRQSSENLKAIIESAVDGIVTIDEFGVINMVNPSAEKIFGYSSDEMIGQDIIMLMPEKYRALHHAGLEKYRETAVINILNTVVEIEGLRKNEEVFPMNLAISEVKFNDRQMFSGIIRDISEKKILEETLFSEKERAQITLASISDGVLTTDEKGKIRFMNPVAMELIGHSTNHLKGSNLTDFVNFFSVEKNQKIDDPLQKCLDQFEIIHIPEMIMCCHDNDKFIVEGHVAPLQGTAGQLMGCVFVFRDITLNRELAHTIKHQATHDSLTGLVNRSEFETRIQRTLERVRNRDDEHIMLVMDLDQFKIVNDTCGHTAGDELLRQLTAQMKSNIRQCDTLARLGGDEFGVLLNNCGAEKAHLIAESIRKSVQDYHFAWNDHSFTLGISIGLVRINHLSPSFTDLYQCADSACYMAKESGRNRIHVYDENSQDVSHRRGEMRWISDINKGIKEDKLVLYFQQIAPVSTTNTLLFFEVLVRYINDEGTVIPPGAFLPAAERYNLSPLIDRWVIKTLFKWLYEHPQQLSRLEHCAINLSGNSLCDKEFTSFVDAQFEQFAIPASSICFEITETSAIINLTEAVKFISHFRDSGCKFSLDDFGSGVSSYGYLKNLPVDYIKIDGTFVRDIIDDPVDRAMVESINKIGQIMGKKTIAEFVENDEIHRELANIGVDYVQGYGIHQPQPLDQLLE